LEPKIETEMGGRLAILLPLLTHAYLPTWVVDPDSVNRSRENQKKYIAGKN